jgi:hypothetical protein
VARPYLINGTKFDLRLYVLLTSVNPLRIYLYDDGLVRFASNKYTNDSSSVSDVFMHLTNYSINKVREKYGLCLYQSASILTLFRFVTCEYINQRIGFRLF